MVLKQERSIMGHGLLQQLVLVILIAPMDVLFVVSRINKWMKRENADQIKNIHAL
jgi:hypothetical protein